MSDENQKPKSALITGISGQDGSYLAEFLLDKDYLVHGIKRRSSSFNTQRIDHIYQDPHEKGRRFILHYGDMSDATNLIHIIEKVQPDEIYNLAAQSHVQVSFETPEYTGNTDGLGVLRLLEAIRILGMDKKTKFYQASTSEMFSGKPGETPQNENTPFAPQSPYGTAKLYGYWLVKNYRDAYKMFAANGILFNHESSRRGETFVTRKITMAASRIALGLQNKLYLGDLDASRDWGHAKDYVRAMWLMLQAPEPEDFVIATGKSRSVREFCQIAFKQVGIELIWQGQGLDEKGIDKKTGKVIIEIDKRYLRPLQVKFLQGDATKARQKLGWVPEISFEQMVKEMVTYDLEQAKRDLHLQNGGFQIRTTSSE